MNQFKTDVITGLQYELQGDYYVIAGEGDERPTVGIWGQRHLRWLRENRRVTYKAFQPRTKENKKVPYRHQPPGKHGIQC